MAFDGAGNYHLPSPAFPAVSGTPVDSANFNTILKDIEAALSQVLTRNGESPWTGDQQAAGRTLFSSVLETVKLTKLTQTRRNLVTANSGAAYAVDASASDAFRLTLTANCTFTLTNPPPVGQSQELTLFLIQDGTGSRLVTWPASVKWPGGLAPTLTTFVSKADLIRLITFDGGVTWQGQVVGQNY